MSETTIGPLWEEDPSKPSPGDLYDILDDEEEYELDLWDEDMDDEDIESDDDY